tara:strand:- start:162 stop:335 length:174 start_codon:yes stop_codon:yes gene_type:complete
MGFSLEVFLNDLEQIIAKKQEPAETVKELAEELAWWKKYAQECGQLKQDVEKEQDND